MNKSNERAAIVKEIDALDASLACHYESEDFTETLHELALQARLIVGAHQSAVSYIPDGDFKKAIHTHSFSVIARHPLFRTQAF